MKDLIMYFILACAISCQTETSLDNIQFVKYIGYDTTYNDRPIESYCIYSSELLLASQDSITIKLQSYPVAPVDSPYNLHGSSMTYKGKFIGYSDNNIKVKWDVDLKEDAVCTETTSNKILFPKNRVTLIDISKDTLCIGNIECVKQK